MKFQQNLCEKERSLCPARVDRQRSPSTALVTDVEGTRHFEWEISSQKRLIFGGPRPAEVRKSVHSFGAVPETLSLGSVCFRMTSSLLEKSACLVLLLAKCKCEQQWPAPPVGQRSRIRFHMRLLVGARETAPVLWEITVHTSNKKEELATGENRLGRSDLDVLSGFALALMTSRRETARPTCLVYVWLFQTSNQEKEKEQ